MGKYSGDQLFRAISRDNNTTTLYFIYFPHHKVEPTKVLYVLPCIISKELLINPNKFIARSGIERVTTGVWDKDKCTFADQNELHNEEGMKSMFEDIGIPELDLDQ